MAFTVDLYTNRSNPNVFSKDITALGSYSCEFKENVDVENPIIYLAAGSSVDGCNYMYIAEFGRYYYAKAITRKGTAIEIQGESDPLMSFKADILSSPAVISRNPWHFDLYVPDPNLPIEARTASGVLKFSGSHFDGTDNCYVLTILGD